MLCPFPYRVPICKIGHMHQSTRFPFAGCAQYLPRSAGWVADADDQMSTVPQHILIGTHNGQLFKDAFHLPRCFTNHIYGILNTMIQNPGIVSIQKICDGLEISVRDFFDDPVLRILIRS